MGLTILLSLITMAGLFLMLWSGVGFIQDKRFFTSAHKEILAVVEPKKERFKGQHVRRPAPATCRKAASRRITTREPLPL